jgi:hypothetical protein
VLAAAIVPHPPILVPALAAGAAPLLEPVLAACETVVAGLLSEGPQVVVCIGSGDRTTRYRPQSWGTLAGYGVGVDGPARHGDEPAELPLSLTIGRWLLERVGWTGAVLLQEVDTRRPAPDCAGLGRELAAEAGSGAAWLVLGDGSNRRGPRSPGHDDPRAEGFDAAVARAFAAADLNALLGLDAGLAAELGVGGRAVWQVLAGAAGATGAARAVADPPGGGAANTAGIEAAVHYDEAPFGVEYLVADWRFR